VINRARVESAARAAFIVAAAGAVALVSIVLFLAVGQPFGTINDVALLVMTMALQPLMLGHYELGGVVPLWPARLSLFGATAAVAGWALLQLAFIVGLATFDYGHAATGALAIQSVLQVIIGLWIAGASLLAGRWLPLLVRLLGMVAGVGTVLVAGGLLLGGSDHPLAWIGGLGYLVALPVWAFLLGRVFRSRAPTPTPAAEASPA